MTKERQSYWIRFKSSKINPSWLLLLELFDSEDWLARFKMIYGVDDGEIVRHYSSLEEVNQDLGLNLQPYDSDIRLRCITRLLKK